MASTYSPLLRIELIATGAQAGLWGNTTNTNLGTLIEQAIAGTATFSVTAGNVTLTESNGVSDQSRCAALLITGSAGVSRNVIAPASSKIYLVSNTADAAIVLKTSSSTGLTIPTGVTQFAYYNGTDFIAASQPYDADLKAIADLATTGIIVRTGSGTAATRSVAVSGTGLSITNADGVSGNPTIASNATSSNTVSTIVARDSSGNFSAGTITAALTGNVTGNVSGNAGTVTNGVYTSGSYADPSWITALASSKLTGQVAIANGGTAASTASGARTNLGLAIGTDVQAYDPELSALAGISTNGMLARTGSGTAAARTITASGSGLSISNGDGVSGNPTITNTGVTSLTAGTAISVSASTGGITVTNTGVTSATAGSGISISASTGGVTFTNTGVLKDSSTGAAYLPAGTTGQRPGSPSAGYFRYNSSLTRFEGYNGSNWGSVGGATGGGNDQIFYENGQTVTANYTITSGTNAMSAGDITIDTGITVTVPDGSNWVIV